MDYLACERAAARLWIPAGNTGSVDVLEIATGRIARVEGFPTAEATLFGEKVTVGPSAVAVGDGVVYIGNRGDSKICVIDARTLARGECIALGGAGGLAPASPDGLAYVAATRELWVTMGAPPLGVAPPDESLAVFDASSPSRLAPRERIRVGGSPEGYAVDERRGRFYTNLEDADRTIAIDVRSHQVVARFAPQCGKEGPRGLAVDVARNLIFVACTDHVVALDGASGARRGSAATGEGVDNID
jgi:DNA-binding beta-propeller fold protein YncE